MTDLGSMVHEVVLLLAGPVTAKQQAEALRKLGEIKILADRQGEEMPDKWISVSEKLPKVGKRVLVTVHGDSYITRTIGIWTSKDWRTASLEKLPIEKTRPIEGTITHWQPLPSPPGEKLAPPKRSKPCKTEESKEESWSMNKNLGTCRAPHFLGEPTSDRKALTQIPHQELPQGLCRNWQAIDRVAATKEPQSRGQDGSTDFMQTNLAPICYMCPAGCGCLWRDNQDGTMSLYGPNSKSCEKCEYMPLRELMPLRAANPAPSQLSPALEKK